MIAAHLVPCLLHTLTPTRHSWCRYTVLPPMTLSPTPNSPHSGRSGRVLPPPGPCPLGAGASSAPGGHPGGGVRRPERGVGISVGGRCTCDRAAGCGRNDFQRLAATESNRSSAPTDSNRSWAGCWGCLLHASQYHGPGQVPVPVLRVGGEAFASSKMKHGSLLKAQQAVVSNLDLSHSLPPFHPIPEGVEAAVRLSSRWTMSSRSARGGATPG